MLFKKHLLYLTLISFIGSAFASNVFDSRYLASKNKEVVDSVIWNFELANEGNARAQFNLGSMYESGIKVFQDNKLAIFWYHKAANQGYPQALNSLGYMYEIGRGVSVDRNKAISLYQQADTKWSKQRIKWLYNKY